MAYVTGIGSYGGVNQYKDRIFVGDDGNNVFPVAGQYYASMMEHAPGAIAGVQNTRNSEGGKSKCSSSCMLEGQAMGGSP